VDDLDGVRVAARLDLLVVVIPAVYRRNGARGHLVDLVVL